MKESTSMCPPYGMVALALAYLDGQGHGLRDPGDVIFTTGLLQGEPGHLLWEFLYKPL